MRRGRSPTLFPYTTLFRSTESVYRRVTFDLTLNAAERLVRRNPNMTFIYVSGGGTEDRKSTRLNSSHVELAYAVFCLKKKSHVVYRRGVHGVVVGECGDV